MGLVPTLQAKRAGEESFGNFFGRIEDWEWEEGHQYTLLIEKLPRNKMLADAPVKFKLHKVIEDKVV